jgi:hypothetical protein
MGVLDFETKTGDFEPVLSVDQIAKVQEAILVLDHEEAGALVTKIEEAIQSNLDGKAVLSAITNILTTGLKLVL